MPDKPLDFSSCPHWGKGGRYVLRADGTRMPVLDAAVAATTEHAAAGTGEPMVAVAGDTLASPAAKAAAPTKPARRNKCRTS